MMARNMTRDALLGERIRPAAGFLPRLVGLIGADGLSPGEGLWISPCTGIHSFGVRFEFDAVFLGPDRRVVGLYERFRRNRISAFYRQAAGVLELPEGVIGRTGTRLGDEVRVEESPPSFG